MARCDLPDSFLPVMTVILPSSASAGMLKGDSESTVPSLISREPRGSTASPSSSTIRRVTVELVRDGIQFALGVSLPPSMVPLPLHRSIRMSLIRVDMVVSSVGSEVTPGADAERTSSRAISSSTPSTSR